MSEAGARLVIVGGSPRSGTTLVQRILNAHPEVTGPGELHLLQAVARMYRTVSSRPKLGAAAVALADVPLEAAAGRLVDDLLNPLTDGEGSMLLSEKSPENVLWFDELGRLLPRARFVLVVRDPVDVVASLLEIGRRAQSSPETFRPAWSVSMRAAAQHTARHLAAGRHAMELLGDRIHLVRYEDLVTNTKNVVGGLCDFLGIEPVVAMSAPGANINPTDLNTVWHDPETYFRQINPTAVGRGQATFSRTSVSLVHSIAGADAAYFGYGIGDGGSVRVRILAAALAVTDRARRSALRPRRRQRTTPGVDPDETA